VIDTRSGTVRWSVNLEWADLPLGPLVESRYGVPVVVANDSHAAALAELTFYRRPRPNNLIVIKVGRGVGAGIIVNGQLFQGDGYGAGEFGHVSPVTGEHRADAVGRAASKRGPACGRWSMPPERWNRRSPTRPASSPPFRPASPASGRSC
jgi:predicted NBD/HSP70 family sugar kinase